VAAAWIGGTSALAATYYVSPGAGQDSYNGLAPAYNGSSGPFQTFQRAINLSGAGDTIFLRSGTYAESVYIGCGTSNAPLVVAAFPGEAPVFTHASGANTLFIQSQGIVLRGITFTTRGVALSNCRNALVEACRFEGITGEVPLYLGSCQNVTVRSNRFVANRHSSVILVQQGQGNIHVLNNELVDNAPHTSGALRVIDIGESSVSLLVAGNLVHNTQDKNAYPIIPIGSPAVAIWAYRSQGVVISNNTVRNFRFRGTVDDRVFDPGYLKTPAQGGEDGDGINVLGSYPVVYESVRVIGNTITNVSGRGIICSYVKNSTLAGNAVLASGRHGIFITGIYGDPTQVTGNVVEDNVVGHTGWLHGGCSGLAVILGGRGNIFRRNFSYQNKQGTPGQVGADWFFDGHGLIADIESHGTIFHNNIAVGNHGVGIALNTAHDCLILNNTSVGNGYSPHMAALGGMSMLRANRATIVNNILYNNRDSSIVEIETARNHVIHHNLSGSGPLTMAAAVNSVIIWNNTRYTLSAWQSLMSGTGNGAGSLEGAPVFAGNTAVMNPVNFRLSGGPGPGAGAALAPFSAQAGFNTASDYGGGSRLASAPTLGAWEASAEAQSQYAFPGGVLTGGGWLWTSWMGFLNIAGFPWVWQDGLGFLYCTGDSAGGLWLYSLDMSNWLWTTASAYPSLYSAVDQSWLWYQAGTKNPKYFYHFNRGVWVSR
jgi:parallel beta-helix repeat protein